MFEQGFVNFTRCNIFAAFDDQFLDSAGDKNKAIFIHPPQITGAQPVIGGDGFGGFFGPVKIALHHI